MKGVNRMVRIVPTQEHEALNAIYARNGLEVTEDEPVSTDTLASWVAYVDDELAGAVTLAFRQNEYIIDGIALEEKFRGAGVGTGLLKTVIADVRNRRGERIFLVARAPEFFRANGFETVNREDAPEFFECFGCDQYDKTCFPEVMKYVV